MIKISDLTKYFQDKEILSSINLTINSGEKVGLVGLNGCGKSTLLKMIMGELAPDNGSITIEAKGKVSYMPQAMSFDQSIRVKDYLCDFEQYKIAEILHQLDLKIDTGKKFLQLSGGQKAKLLLAKILLEEPTIFLLDEPTNHLDLRAIIWLENFIQKTRSTVVVVSHDRRFLDNVVTKILELDTKEHQLTEYEGNYSAYQSQKKSEEGKKRQRYDDAQKKIDKYQESFIDQKRWSAKAAKGPKKTDNEKLLRNAKKDKSALFDRRAKALEKRINELQEVEYLQKIQKPKISLTNDLKHGQLLLQLKNISKVFDGIPVLHELDLKIKSGEKVVIVGDNGCGKTTLFKIVRKEIEPDRGDIYINKLAKIGYLPQEYYHLSDKRTAYEYFKSQTSIDESWARTLLASFGLNKNILFQPLSVLSPGEKARLLLTILDANKNNLLLLDESTNHLDFLSLEIIEKALCDYDGAFLAITHDRFFVDKIKPDSIYLLENGRLEKTDLL